jgi:predicted NBD/HSP70 family sugar kinase
MSETVDRFAKAADDALNALLAAIRDPKRYAIGGELNALMSACREQGHHEFQENHDQLITRERDETEEKTREQIRSTKVKETTYTNQDGVICLAYVIPAASLDVTVTEAHKRLMQWALIGATVLGGKR